jgi:hypothetical protein
MSNQELYDVYLELYNRKAPLRFEDFHYAVMKAYDSAITGTKYRPFKYKMDKLVATKSGEGHLYVGKEYDLGGYMLVIFNPSSYPHNPFAQYRISYTNRWIPIDKEHFVNGLRKLKISKLD